MAYLGHVLMEPPRPDRECVRDGGHGHDGTGGGGSRSATIVDFQNTKRSIREKPQKALV